MSTSFMPSTEEIAVVFADEVRALGGSVSDSFDDGARLFARAILGAQGEVRPGDKIKAGIALRVAGPIVAVHPYTYREICSNGAIAAQVTGTREIQRVEFISATEFTAAAVDEIRLAIRRSGAPEVFNRARDEMHLASYVSAELMIHALPMLARLPAESRNDVFGMLVQEYGRANDRTLYGVMNAVTAVARETRDPETKWELEAFGGAIPARAREAVREQPVGQDRERELVAV